MTVGDFYPGYLLSTQAWITVVWPLGEGWPWPSIFGWQIYFDGRGQLLQAQGLAEGGCTSHSSDTLGRLDVVGMEPGICFS